MAPKQTTKRAASVKSEVKTTPKQITKRAVAPKQTTKRTTPLKSKPKPKGKAAADDPATEWKPPKTQKTDLERSISRVGATVPKSLKPNDKDATKREERVLSSGPKGPDVLDRLGYKLSLSSINRSRTRPRKKKNWLEEMEREAEEDRRIAEIMGVPRDKVSAAILAMFKDQVACDLDIPYHTVEIAEFEEWGRRGFTFAPERWQEKQSEEEEARLWVLQVGSAFRA